MSTSGKWPPLHDDTKPGDPVAKIRGDEYAKICRVLNTLQVIGGTLVKTADGRGWQLIIGVDELGAAYEWVVYLGGVKFGPLVDESKNFIRVRVDQNTVEEHAGPAPNPMPPGEEWYDKRTTPRGDIHVTRFG